MTPKVTGDEEWPCYDDPKYNFFQSTMAPASDYLWLASVVFDNRTYFDKIQLVPGFDADVMTRNSAHLFYKRPSDLKGVDEQY